MILLPSWDLMRMNSKIKINKKAQKFVEKQSIEQQKRLLKAIYTIPSGDIKKLARQDDLYRLRVGDYRIIFSMSADLSAIFILNIGNRGDVYK